MERPSFNNKVTIQELLHRGASALEATSSSARLDSEVLLGHVLGYSRTQLIINATDGCVQEAVASFNALVEQRRRGEPVAYIIGEREFWGLSFKVTPAVLVPRPESELLVQEALAFVGERREIRFVDLGVGSGCLSIAIVSELVKQGCDVHCVGVDSSPEALAVAGANATRLGMEDRITYVQGDWCTNLADFNPPYDLIIANPPYIDRAEEVPVELSFEPPGALFADEHGLRDVRMIIEQSARILKPDGVLLCEVGAGKRKVLHTVLPAFAAEYEVHYLGDDSVEDRFTVLKLVRR